MPLIPPISIQNYDTVNTVLNTTRGRLNDAISTLYPVSGKLLNNNGEFTLQTFNSAYRKMQDCLADRGYATMTSEVLVYNLPVSASVDPGSQVWLGWAGYYDGANYFPAITLPADFTHPLKLWERWSGQNSAFGRPMEKMLDGLPAIAKGGSNHFWEWRGDTIYMPGSQRAMDLRIRYVRYLADFADIGQSRWFTQTVPIMRSADSLSWFICAEVSGARGDPIETQDMFMNKAMASLNHIFNLDVRADQRVNVQRRPLSGRR